MAGRTEADQAARVLSDHDTVALRFPLVARPRPACRVLGVRVAEVRDLAQAAASATDESLTLAAEAHNKAALILSDCGLPDLARRVCWQQVEVYLTAAGPFTAATAKLALQPVVNLSRLLIRSGDGAAAYAMLNSVFEAVKSQTDAVVDGRKVAFGNFVSDDEARSEVVRMLWAVLLADGTRALAQAGQWHEALRHVRQHQGIGDRLLDGRQIAILAQCTAPTTTALLRL